MGIALTCVCHKRLVVVLVTVIGTLAPHPLSPSGWFGVGLGDCLHTLVICPSRLVFIAIRLVFLSIWAHKVSTYVCPHPQGWV